jgi:hypothetical protein
MTKHILAKEWLQEKRKRVLVYEDQKIVGEEIVRSLKDKIVVTLCAPPQWGKTGVSLYVSYKLSLQKIKHVFYLTGMSDKTWVEQTKERLLPSWKDNVYHRNTLNRFMARVANLKMKKKDKNILLIIDECHIANRKEHILSEIMDVFGIQDIRCFKDKNIRILQISATPSNALVDAEELNEYHQKIIPVIHKDYVSFHTFLKKDKLKTPYALSDLSQCEQFIQHFKRFPDHRYHFVRISSKGPSGKVNYQTVKNNLKLLCDTNHFELIQMDGSVKKEQIHHIYQSLSVKPDKHTIIIIKDMLGAAKTIDDTYIGCVHESTPDKKDYSSEVQGLPGRLCGWTKQKGNNSPIIFCNREIIETYMNLYDTDFCYQNDEYIEWKDNKVRVNSQGKVLSKRSYLSIDD